MRIKLVYGFSVIIMALILVGSFFVFFNKAEGAVDSVSENGWPPCGRHGFGDSKSCIIYVTSGDPIHSQTWAAALNGIYAHGHGGSSQVKVTVCISDIVGMWQGRPCWIPYDNTNFPDTGGNDIEIIGNWSANVGGDYSKYYYVVIDFYVMDAEASVGGSVTNEFRRVSIDNFTAPPSANVGQAFDVSWNTGEAFNGVTLSWTVPGAGTSSQPVGTNGTMSFTATQPGTAYFTLCSSGPGHNSGGVTICTDGSNHADPWTPPDLTVDIVGGQVNLPGPFNLNNTSCSGGDSIPLSWGSSSNASSYAVFQRRWSSGVWENLATITGNSYTVNGVTLGEDRYFFIRAINSYGNTDSNTIGAINCPIGVNPPPPPQPGCGNGIVESGEACDNGSGNNVCPSNCSTSCQFNNCSGPPPPPPPNPPPPSPPFGSHDEGTGPTACFRIYGWAADCDSPNQSLTVKVYKDGAFLFSGPTTFYDGGLNSVLSSAYCPGIPVSGDHRFGTSSTVTPYGFNPIHASLIDNLPHTIRVTAVDPLDGTESPLSFTDKIVQCFVPTQPSVAYPACSNTPYTATVSWAGGSPTWVFYYGTWYQGYIVDIDDDSGFNSFYNKIYSTTASGPYSTDTSSFFGIYPTSTQTMTLYPGVTYYTRVFNGTHGPATSWSVPLCPAPNPTVNITANGSEGPVTVPNGSSALLSWTSTNTDPANPTPCSASVNWSGVKVPSGTQSTSIFSAPGTYTYTITCNGQSGTTPATDTVVINVPSLPIVDIDARPDSGGTPSDGPVYIPVGTAAILSWNASNASSCTATRYWSGSGAQPLTQADPPGISAGVLSTAGTYDYGLSCTGSGGTFEDVVTVIALNAPTCSGGAGPDGVAATSATHDVFAYGVSSEVTGVNFYVWSDVNGQDDLLAYAGTNLGGGTWRATVNFANHRPGNPDYGSFRTHVYMVAPGYPPGGSLWGQWCDTADFTRASIPSVGSATVTVSNSNYCAVGVHATVSWTYTDSSGSPQAAYQVQVDDDTDPLSGNPEWESPTVLGTGTSSSTPLCDPLSIDNSPQLQCQMNWNTTYSAWARVQNGYGQWSPWTLMSTYCNGASCGPATSWTTPLHAFPQADFTFSPANPSANSPVTFTDATVFALSSINRTWSWNFGGGTPGMATGQGPHNNTYPTVGTYSATLTSSDDVGSCTAGPQTLTVQRALPRWREIAPH